jgi:hypothetical protein
MPKLHKPRLPDGDPKTRPILANRPDNINYRISKIIGIWINNFIASIQHTPILQNSMEMVNAIANTYTNAQDILFTFDINNLYGEINLEDMHHLLNDGLDTTNDTSIQFLLHAALNGGTFIWDNELWKQTEGIAMGAPAAAPGANLYMYYKLDIPLLNAYQNKLRLYKRYIDDSVGIFNGTYHEYFEFIETIQRLIFPMTLEENHSEFEINFLDLTIFKRHPTSRLATKVFQKVDNTYQYLPFASSHPQSLKRGFIKGELIRYYRISTYRADFLRIRTALWERLRRRGYPRDFLLPIFRSHPSAIQRQTLPNQRLATLSLPYTRSPLNRRLQMLIRDAEALLKDIDPNIKLLLTFRMEGNLGHELISSPLRPKQSEFIHNQEQALAINPDTH